MNKFRSILIYSILTLATLMVFWQVRNFDFINYDDPDYVSQNQHVLNGLTPGSIYWAFTSGFSANWHPLTWLSLMLDCRLFSQNPGSIHFVNLIFHILNTLLLFALLKNMTGSLWKSAFVAAAFALHPMHVESVTWISERKDVLSTFFMLLTLSAYVNYVRNKTNFRYLLTLLLFTFGLLAKSMLVTLPFLLLLLDYWPLKRLDQPLKTSSRHPKKSQALSDPDVLKKLIIEKIPFFILAVIFSIVTFLVQQAAGAVTKIENRSLLLRFENASLSYIRYICKMFWPKNLAVFYPFDSNINILYAVGCLLLLITVTILAIYLGRKYKYLPVGWFWFLGTLVPVIGIIQVGQQAMADRYSYISFIGLFIIIAWGLPELLSKWKFSRIALALAAIGAVIAMSIVTYKQTSYWKNSFTLYDHTLNVTKNNHIIQYNLGSAYGDIGDFKNAMLAYQQAIESYPDYAQAHNNLGAVYGSLGQHQKAIEYCSKAIQLDPGLADAYYNLGISLGNIGRSKEEIEAYKKTIAINPKNVNAQYNLGVAYLIAGNKDLAIQQYNILKTLDPKKADQLFPPNNPK